MSVKSIKDPRTAEYLAPTDAIRRGLLDPYKGLFFNPLTQQHMPISDAIQEGYVLVEMIANSPASKSSSGKSSNIVSTSLIRETKSYHLLAVLDTTRNVEISIKEAIARGILDRQKGVYVNPVSKSEVYSISDAIQKGFIRARILTPPLLNSAAAASSSSCNLAPASASKTSLNNNNNNNAALSTSSSSSSSSSHQHEEQYQTLVSTNRFEENRTYTISGAVDTRSGRRCTLSEAIADGLINVKTGSYLNLKTGESMTINRAIELNLVLTTETSAADENNNSAKITHAQGKIFLFFKFRYFTKTIKEE
jgi:hypothetical protein